MLVVVQDIAKIRFIITNPVALASKLQSSLVGWVRQAARLIQYHWWLLNKSETAFQVSLGKCPKKLLVILALVTPALHSCCDLAVL